MLVYLVMTLAEAVVIYLSIGAPFGVMAYFDARIQGTLLAVIYGLLGGIAWPGFGARRLIQHFSQKHFVNASGTNNSPSLEFLKLAGHSNPELGAACLQRLNEDKMHLRSLVDETGIESTFKESLAERIGVL